MLQFITHTNQSHPDPAQGALAALQGGCRWIQLRMKHADASQILEQAAVISQMCREYGATFILDDHVELVPEARADGVHLGKNDMPVAEARRLLGPDRIIGATANTFSDIEGAAVAGADYIGLGPFRFTETKQKLSPVLGLEGYRSIMAQCRAADISLPVVAIGGITLDDLPAIMATGVSGVAVSGAILNAPNPVLETSRFIAESTIEL